jgi:hypothetical protein
MQGKLQMLCNALATSPLQACFNTHSKPTRAVMHKVANVANNKTKTNKDSPAVAVVAPTTAAGKMDSTEAMATVAGITKAVAQPLMAAVAVIPPKAPQTLHHQSRNSTI